MLLSAVLQGRRESLIAERNALLDVEDPADFTPEAEARATAINTEVTELDTRVAEVLASEAREAAAAAARVETGTVPVGDGVRAEANPVYRKNDVHASYFRDLFNAQVKGDSSARSRLVDSQERALSTTAGAGGQFAPPLWMVDDYIALARAARVTADLMNKRPLPDGVASINVPKVATGVTTAVQSNQNTGVSNTDMTTSSVASGITTIAGQQVVAMQLLSQSGIPFDEVVLGDLAASYATQLDLQVISGSGASGQLRGLTSGAGVGTTTFTTTTPAVTSATAANSFYNKLIAAATSIHTSRYQPPTAIVMHPVRWGWVLEALDSQVRPLITPQAYPQFNAIGSASSEPVAQGSAGSLVGLPVYLDPNIPQNLGVGVNQDEVFVIRQNDLWLWESEVQSASFDATYANQASILFRVLGYAAFIPDRYGPSVNVISGTGLVTPAL